MSLKIIVGLGNPGQKYTNTRHNIGFDTVDLIARRLGMTVETLKWKAMVGEAREGADRILLVKPQTYMNKSGESLREIVQFYKVDPSDVLVILDDVDIKLGRIRMRANGSAGTHNGLRSIVQLLGTDQFPRLRVSIGRRPMQMDLADFVLSRYTDAEQKAVEEEMEAAADCALMFVKEGAEAAMNRFNGWVAPSTAHPTEEEKEREAIYEAERAEEDAFLRRAHRCGE